MQIKHTPARNNIAKIYKLNNYLVGAFVILFLCVGFANASESWTCDAITLPDELGVKSDPLAVNFSLTLTDEDADIPKSYAICSLSKKGTKIQGVGLGVNAGGNLTSLSDKLAKYPEVTYSIKTTQSYIISPTRYNERQWEVTFSKWITGDNDVENWTNKTVPLTNCVKKLTIDIDRLDDGNETANPKTPLNGRESKCPKCPKCNGCAVS